MTVYGQISDSQIAKDSYFLTTELRSTQLTYLTEQFKPLNGLRLIPVRTEPNPLVEAVGARLSTGYGRAKWVDVVLDPQDIPNVDLSRSEEYKPVRNFAIGAVWSDDELAMAAALGLRPDMEKTTIALRELDWLENDLIFNGYANGGISGIFTSGLIGTTALTNGDWTNAATTADDIYADLVQMALFIRQNTSTARNERVRIVLPIAAYDRANTLPRTTLNGDSVLKVFLQNMGTYVESIDSAIEFDTQKEALVYIPNSEYMHHRLVMPTQAMPLLRVGYAYKQVWRRRSAGVLVNNSTTQRRFTGILV